jgi:2,5-furandicarboxylate decarboxylase 1
MGGGGTAVAKDLRSWIDTLESHGELARIARPVDPLTEMGALLYQSREKALFFEHLTGFPGWRSLGNGPANLRQAALAFGVPMEDMVPTLAARMDERVPVEHVATGPVKEVVLKGDDVDLTRLPVHVAGTRDVGPVMGSGLCITRDPDTGIYNMCFHRLQLKGPRRTGILVLPRHTRRIYEKYESRGEAMPIAVMVGHHPLVYMAAATTGPFEMNELELAGALLGEPLRCVACETVDLEVPADAEIILEGHILPGVREPEGPFSEFQDYYFGGTGMNPVVQYDCITMRRDAIFKTIQNGSEMEGCIYHKVPMGAAIFRHIRNIGGGVDLKNVLILPGIFALVVQMTQRVHGEAKQVLMAALATPYLHPKVAIAVDEDVNPFDYWQVLWAMNTRVDPQDDVIVIPGVRQHPMDATGREFGDPGQSNWHKLGGKLMIDATKPPTSDPERRRLFERIRPMGDGKVRLEDYLPPSRAAWPDSPAAL